MKSKLNISVEIDYACIKLNRTVFSKYSHLEWIIILENKGNNINY